MNPASPARREHWRRIIQQQKGSGLSVARFCRERRIGESSLFAWKRRLAGGAGVAATPPAFVLLKPAPANPPASAAVDSAHTPELSVGGSHPSAGAIELHLGGGRRILLRPGFDAPTLAAALAVLEGGDSRREGR